MRKSPSRKEDIYIYMFILPLTWPNAYSASREKPALENVYCKLQ